MSRHHLQVDTVQQQELLLLVALLYLAEVDWLQIDFVTSVLLSLSLSLFLTLSLSLFLLYRLAGFLFSVVITVMAACL